MGRGVARFRHTGAGIMTGPEHDRPRRPGASPRSGTPPPAGSPWKKGESGNPKGRPKSASVTEALRRLLEQEHRGVPIAELVAQRLLKEALSGSSPLLRR